jgi:hypothetical protein
MWSPPFDLEVFIFPPSDLESAGVWGGASLKLTNVRAAPLSPVVGQSDCARRGSLTIFLLP